MVASSWQMAITNHNKLYDLKVYISISLNRKHICSPLMSATWSHQRQEL